MSYSCNSRREKRSAADEPLTEKMQPMHCMGGGGGAAAAAADDDDDDDEQLQSAFPPTPDTFRANWRKA